MRQSSSRSAIYVVIGIGLLILTVSQLRRGDEASNASFVAKSSPFEALKDYQPAAPLADIGQELVNKVEAPQLSMPKISLDEIAAKLPVEFPTDSIETNFDMVADFVNTPKAVEMPAAPPESDDSFYDLDFEGSEQLQTAMEDEPTNAESFDSAVAATLEVTPESLATVERVSTDMPAFSSLSKFNNNGQKQIINNHLVSPSGESQNGNLQSTRWKKNPFLTDAPVTSDTADAQDTADARGTADTWDTVDAQQTDTIAVDILPVAVEALIQTEFADSPDELSTVANLEPASKISNEEMVPSIDHETIRSVIAAENNLEASSPAIKIGISQADAQKAVHNIEYGKSLSRRGAAFAARQEFYSSLRILAQSHDKEAGGTKYTQALRNGIIAIKEAQDFIVTDTETQIGLSVPNVAETHSTKIISAESAQGMTAIEAVQRYFAYASHQLSRCGGQNVVAAEALYCLGKLQSVQAKSGTDSSKLDIATAMVYHQAAIAADTSNFRSLNELGVLYANSGRFDESKRMLKSSLRIKQLPQAWQNLSVIHQRMGENNLAQMADREFQMASTQAPTSVIRWTEATEFNANAPMVQRTASQDGSSLPSPAGKSDLKSLGSRILDKIR